METTGMICERSILHKAEAHFPCHFSAQRMVLAKAAQLWLLTMIQSYYANQCSSQRGSGFDPLESNPFNTAS